MLKQAVALLVLASCLWAAQPLRAHFATRSGSSFLTARSPRPGPRIHRIQSEELKTDVWRLQAVRDGSRPSNEYGLKFERMLQRCREYDDELLDEIEDARLRALVKGVVDGSRTPEVREGCVASEGDLRSHPIKRRRSAAGGPNSSPCLVLVNPWKVTNAFRILYEDYLPLRVSGDFIFRRMDGIVQEVRRRRASGIRVARSNDSMRLTNAQISAERTYRRMLEDVAAWEAALDEDKFGRIRNQRLGNVLIGCFVGARTDGVVNALKILYMDYTILRTGGNLIFALMKGAVRPYVDQTRVRSLG
eukprot:scaffold1452_cov236-Pinguiococcus_pyrenoidosus.AAC.6